jgi:predicted metal-dependent peptidase
MAVNKPTEAQLQLLGRWRVEALELMPYMAHILFAMRPFNSTSTNSFACDERYRLYINFENVEREFSDQLSAEALLHECAHLFSNDKERGDEAGVPMTPEARKRWNRACDAANNDDLVEGGCVALGDYGVLPEHFGMSRHLLAEAYYAALSKSSSSPNDGSNDDGDGDGSDGSDDGDDDDGSGGDGDGDGDGDDDDGSGGDGGSDGFRSDDNCGSASGNPSVAEDDDTGDEGLGEIGQEIKRIVTADEIRRYESLHRGSVPDGLLHLAEMVLAPPVVPWQRVLSSHIRGSVSSRPGTEYSTYSRRNRRIPSFNGVAMPGTFSPSPKVVVVRDTSGSINAEMLMKISSEIVGISRQLGVRGRELVVLDVDAATNNQLNYRQASDLATRFGSGGTDMRVGIASATELRPSVTIVLTDGETPWPDEPNGIPLVVCLVGEPRNDPPTWARTVRIPRD